MDPTASKGSAPVIRVLGTLREVAGAVEGPPGEKMDINSDEAKEIFNRRVDERFYRMHAIPLMEVLYGGVDKDAGVETSTEAAPKEVK